MNECGDYNHWLQTYRVLQSDLLRLYHTSLRAILQFHHIRAMLRKIPQWQLFVSDFTSKHRNLMDQGSDTAFSEAFSLLLDEATLH